MKNIYKFLLLFLVLFNTCFGSGDWEKENKLFFEKLENNRTTCQNLYGIHSYAVGDNSCGCFGGYIMDNFQNECISIANYCSRNYPNTIPSNTEDSCICKDGFINNNLGTGCIKKLQ